MKSYRTGGDRTRVLDGVSFELARGEVTSLTGASGSGKSTLISLIAGLLAPDAGSVVFDGLDLGALRARQAARLRAQRIGVALQSGNLIPFLSAAENVELALGFAGRPRPAARARELLTELGLSHRIDHRPQRISGGEAQRVALAVALANAPDLLLADEVAGELDSVTARLVVDVIFETARQHGLTVLFVTHSRELAERAQRRLRLVDGRVEEE